MDDPNKEQEPNEIAGAPADAANGEANASASDTGQQEAAPQEPPASAPATDSPVETVTPVQDASRPAALPAMASAKGFAHQIEEANALASGQQEAAIALEAPSVDGPIKEPYLQPYRVLTNISHQGAQKLEDDLNSYADLGYHLEGIVRCTDGAIAILYRG